MQRPSKVIRMQGVPPLLVKNRALVLSDFKWNIGLSAFQTVQAFWYRSASHVNVDINPQLYTCRSAVNIQHNEEGRGEQGRAWEAQPWLVHWRVYNRSILMWLITNDSHKAGCKWHLWSTRRKWKCFIPRIIGNNYPLSWEQPLSQLRFPFVYSQISIGDFLFQSRKCNQNPSPYGSSK